MTCTGASHSGAIKTLWLSQNLTGTRLLINQNAEGLLTAVPDCGVEETHLVSVLGCRPSLIGLLVFLRRPNRCTASSLSPAPAWHCHCVCVCVCVCVYIERKEKPGWNNLHMCVQQQQQQQQQQKLPGSR